MEFHQIAECFPLATDAELKTLAESIEADGLMHQITTFEGKILDGRNRWRAFELIGREPELVDFQEFEGDWDAAIEFVRKTNMDGWRHLTDSQRALAGAKLATLKHGGDRRSDQAAHGPLVSQARAAEIVGASERSVRRGRQVLGGVPELAEAVERGEIKVRPAAELASRAPEAQRAALAAGREGVRRALTTAPVANPVPLTENQKAVRRRAKTDNLFLGLTKAMAEIKAMVSKVAEGDLALSAEQRDVGIELAAQFINAGEWLRTLLTNPGQGEVSDEALRAWLTEGDK